jgi:hypothetical protein
MRIPLLMALLVLVLVGRATATVRVGLEEQPGLLCRQAIAVAEAAHAIPTHLLAAIGRVESGRRDPNTGLRHPWPWTINAEGEGHFFESKAQAIAFVTALQARGARSIDVGCMQVNLMYHPTAFTGLDQAFDPRANADYAAQFLRQLYGQTNNWPKATAFYHSATPELGEPYQQQVMNVWPQEANISPVSAPSALASAWAATITSFPPPFQHGPVARIIPLPRGLDGSTTPGRDLASYRAAPVMLAPRALLQPRAGG